MSGKYIDDKITEVTVMVKIDNHWHRVYCMNYGNSGVLCVRYHKEEWFIHDYTIDDLLWKGK